MTIELPEDLAEQVADWFAIYGCCDQNKCVDDMTCCRTAFVPMLTERIQASVVNAQKLAAADFQAD